MIISPQLPFLLQQEPVEPALPWRLPSGPQRTSLQGRWQQLSSIHRYSLADPDFQGCGCHSSIHCSCCTWKCRPHSVSSHCHLCTLQRDSPPGSWTCWTFWLQRARSSLWDTPSHPPPRPLSSLPARQRLELSWAHQSRARRMRHGFQAQRNCTSDKPGAQACWKARKSKDFLAKYDFGEVKLDFRDKNHWKFTIQGISMQKKNTLFVKEGPSFMKISITQSTLAENHAENRN